MFLPKALPVLAFASLGFAITAALRAATITPDILRDVVSSAGLARGRVHSRRKTAETSCTCFEIFALVAANSVCLA